LGYLAALQLSKIVGYVVLVGARSTGKGEDAVKRILADTEGGAAQSSVEVVLVDLDDDETLHAAIKQIEVKFGKLDVLVVSPHGPRVLPYLLSPSFQRDNYLTLFFIQNNAAILIDNQGPGVVVDKSRPPMAIRNLLETTYRTNVFGVAVLTEAALPLLEKSEFPRIVNVSSGLGSHTNLTNPSSMYYHARTIVSFFVTATRAC
jgi:NAD(P)-dependent dehydrogenase (short-subunit alcohol dehydrogenase family)